MPAEKTGWLQKQGTGVMKSFEKRWVHVSGNILKYGKKENEAKEEINYTNATISKVAPKKKESFCFEIQTTKAKYCFAAESESERDKWIKFFEENKSGEAEKKKLTQADFELMNLIGKGSFGKVIQVKKKDTGDIYAMKVLDKKHIVENQEVDHTMAEKAILQMIRHPFLVNLNWSFQTQDKLFFVLDFVNGGELFYHLQREKKFPLSRVRLYSAEILLALEHLHKNGIIYRDLKPENILLNAEGHICLTDFGLSKTNMKEGDKASTFCGTPEYLAPEVLKGKGYTKAVDFWSYGCLVYEMLTGLPPFYSADVQEMYKKIVDHREGPLKFPSSFDPDALDFLTQLLERDLSKRLSTSDEIKNHKFFTVDGQSLDWKKLYDGGYKPEYIPPVKGKDDVHLVDPMFLEEKADISPSESPVDGGEHFQNFTYVKGDEETEES